MLTKTLERPNSSSARSQPISLKGDCEAPANDAAPKLNAGQLHRLNLIRGLADIARYFPDGRLRGWQSCNGNFIWAKQSDRDLLALAAREAGQ